MIPAAYWSFLFRWSWLLALFFIGGAFLGGKMHDAGQSYMSQSVVEVDYALQPDGTISSDMNLRREQAALLANEVTAYWTLREVSKELGDMGLNIPTNILRPMLMVSSPTTPRDPTKPALITITASASSPDVAQQVAKTTAEVFVRLISQRNVETLKRIDESNLSAATYLSNAYYEAVQARRNALGPGVSDSYQKMLDTLHTAQADLAAQLETFERLAATAGSGDSLALAADLRELRLRIRELSDEFEANFIEAQAILTGATGSAEYQSASLRESVIRAQLQEVLGKLSNPSMDPALLRNQLLIRESGSEPTILPFLGFPKRYALVFGGVVGFLLAWVLGNLGDYLRGALRNRAILRPSQGTPASPSPKPSVASGPGPAANPGPEALERPPGT